MILLFISGCPLPFYKVATPTTEAFVKPVFLAYVAFSDSTRHLWWCCGKWITNSFKFLIFNCVRTWRHCYSAPRAMQGRSRSPCWHSAARSVALGTWAALGNHCTIPYKLEAVSLGFEIQPSTHNRVLDHPPIENKILLILADVIFSSTARYSIYFLTAQGIFLSTALLWV